MKKIFVMLIATVLAACGTSPQKAPVEDLNKSGISTTTTLPKADDHSRYVVKKGDTLYRIAFEKGQSYSDLISWNNLANPNDIKVGQVLRVAPPDTNSSLGVSPSVVEVRPLGSVNPNAPSAVTAPSGNNKNGPRADKRPYSDAALAELQKEESANVASGKTAVASVEKPPEKTQPSSKTEEISWVWPADSKPSSTFEEKKSKGIDFRGKAGQNVYAAAAGKVMYAGPNRGYGNLIVIKHSNNFLSAYAHNQSILVKENQVISKGQKIAEMGNLDSDVVKLHFEIRQQGKPVDPLKFLPSR